MMNREVVFDRANARVGFRRQNCSAEEVPYPAPPPPPPAAGRLPRNVSREASVMRPPTYCTARTPDWSVRGQLEIRAMARGASMMIESVLMGAIEENGSVASWLIRSGAGGVCLSFCVLELCLRRRRKV